MYTNTARVVTFVLLVLVFLSQHALAADTKKAASSKSEPKSSNKADPIANACKQINDQRKKKCGDLKKQYEDAKKRADSFDEFRKKNPQQNQFPKQFLDAEKNAKENVEIYKKGAEKSALGLPPAFERHTTDFGCTKDEIAKGIACAKKSDKDNSGGLRGRNSQEIKGEVDGKKQDVGAEFCEVGKDGQYTGNVSQAGTSMPYTYFTVEKTGSTFSAKDRNFCMDEKRLEKNAAKKCAETCKDDGVALWNPIFGQPKESVQKCGDATVSGIKDPVPVVCRKSYADNKGKAGSLDQAKTEEKDYNPYTRPTTFVEKKSDTATGKGIGSDYASDQINKIGTSKGIGSDYAAGEINKIGTEKGIGSDVVMGGTFDATKGEPTTKTEGTGSGPVGFDLKKANASKGGIDSSAPSALIYQGTTYKQESTQCYGSVCYWNYSGSGGTVQVEYGPLRNSITYYRKNEEWGTVLSKQQVGFTE